MSEIMLRNGQTLLVRKAMPEDAGQILPYLKVVGSESDNLLFGAEGVPYTLEQEVDILKKMATSTTSVMLAAVLDGQIVGIANLSSSPRERICHHAELGISVLKSCWHLGVGSALMQALIEFAKNTKVLTIIHLKVRTDNTHAIRLYHKYGFRDIGTFERYMRVNGIYYDTLMMNLEL